MKYTNVYGEEISEKTVIRLNEMADRYKEIIFNASTGLKGVDDLLSKIEISKE